MTFNGTIEFILHLESFRNIDLYHQGIYYLKGYLYSEKPNSQERIYATPYSLLESYKNIYREPDLEYFQSNANKKEFHFFEKSMIVTEEQYFKSKSFMIRYYEEEIDMNDIFLFRLDLQAYPDFSTQEVFLEIELVGSDLSKIGKPAEEGEGMGASQMFNTVSVFKSKLNFEKVGGIHEFLPIIFDEAHFCVCNATVHSLLLDFKFRLNEVQLALAQKNATTNNITQEKNKENKKELFIFLQPKNFTEFLNKATKKFQKENLDKFYDIYVQSLRNSYGELITFLSEFKDFALDKKAYKLKEEFQHIVSKENRKLPPAFFQPKKDACQEMKYVTPVFFQSPRNSSSTKKKIFEEKKQNSLFFAGEVPKESPDKPSKCVTLSSVKDQEKFSEQLLTEMNFISGLSYEFWGHFLEYIKLFPGQIVSLLRPKYLKSIKERWGESIFRDEIPTNDLALSIDSKAGEKHKNIASQMRKKFYYQNLENLTIEDLNMFPKPEYHPIVFEEIYRLGAPNSPKTLKKNKANLSKTIFNNNPALSDRDHLFVLVHGFQGTSFDMRLLKDNLSLLHPNALFLCSSANEDGTDGDINEMGRNLANEVKGFIQEWCAGDSPKKISFVGHSLGGVIIRTALPHLKIYENKMHSFLSLSSPHLGYMYNTSKLIDAGIWILKRWKKSKCLQQLSMSDAENLEETFLFRLAQYEGLNWFTNIGLISSYQDQYVPFESARIQKSQNNSSSTNNSNKWKLYKTMAESLLSNLKTDKVHRIDVNFEIPQKTFENIIGRAAHIQFLESQPLMRMLVHCFDKFFN